MSTVSIDLPGNVNPLAPLTADCGGTGVSNPLSSGIALPDGNLITIHTTGTTVITLPTTGTLISAAVNGTIDHVVQVDSATPGTMRSFTGDISNISTTMTSGNLVGIRGAVTVPVGSTVSGGYLYGTQGKMIINGTISGSAWCPAVFGQLDISSSTLSPGGQIACLWGDAGTTGPSETVADFNMIRLTNTTSTIANALFSSYGQATYVMDLQLNGGVQFLNAGTSVGSAGDTTKCNATKVLAIRVDGVAYWIPAFAQNT